MPTTTTYDLRLVRNISLDKSNDEVASFDIISQSNGGVFVSFEDTGIDGQFFSVSGSSSGAFDIAAGSDPASTQLSNGNNVTIYQVAHAAGQPEAKFKITSPSTGAVIGTERSATTSGLAGDFNVDIAATTGGGFATTHSFQNAGDPDDWFGNVSYWSSSGGGPTTPSGFAPEDGEEDMVVAALNDGGVAIAVTQNTTGSPQIEYAILNADGTSRLTDTFLGNAQSSARKAIVGLANGGFAIAYEATPLRGDEGSGDIVYVSFDANGNITGENRVTVDSGVRGETEFNPSLAVLDDKHVVLGYTDFEFGNNDTYVSILDGVSGAVLCNEAIGITSENEFGLKAAGMAQGRLAILNVVGDAFHTDPSFEVSGGIYELVQFKKASNGSGATLVGDDFLVDVLEGGNRKDVLSGLGGDDTLIGGRGKDLLLGGADSDKFVFQSIKDSRKGGKADKIGDFSKEDVIDLSDIDAKKGGGNQKFKWIGKQAFHDKKGELHYEKKGGKLLVEGDVNGDGKADFQIKVDGPGLHNLHGNDFIL